MRVLFLTNFYPPHKIGGYEMLCQDVVEAFRIRGHKVTVLTSKGGGNTEVSEGFVHRLLSLESDLDYYRPIKALRYPFVNVRNIHHLRRLISSSNPDIFFVWGMWSLSKQLLAEAERLLDSRVIYYLANPWPIEANIHKKYWETPARRKFTRLLKKILKVPMKIWLRSEWEHAPLEFQHAPCCSKALRNQLKAAGVPLKESPIIYEGIDLERYSHFGDQRSEVNDNRALSLLFVGILAQHKGVHTTIEAIAQLSKSNQQNVKLTILGTGHPQYEAKLHNLTGKYNLNQTISFHEPIPRTELPEFLYYHDILLLPSIWEEPLALIMQEGLASGMVVIGSNTGGTKEIISDHQNGFLFNAGDPSSLAKKIEILINDRTLLHEVAMRGMKTAQEKFNFGRMVDDLEDLLYSIRP